MSDFGSGRDLTFVSSSPTSGSWLTAQSLEPALDSVFLSAPPPFALCFSKNKIRTLKKIFFKKGVLCFGSCCGLNFSMTLGNPDPLWAQFLHLLNGSRWVLDQLSPPGCWKHGERWAGLPRFFKADMGDGGNELVCPLRPALCLALWGGGWA